MKPPRVCIDAGHGGPDPGVIGIDGMRESDVALKLALETAEQAAALGLEVTLTRSEGRGVALPARVEQSVGHDCLVSLHTNGFHKESAHGLEVICGTGQSRALAQTIHQALVKETGRRDRGVKESPSQDYPRRLYLISKQVVPTVIVEPEFLTNEEGGRWVASEDGIRTIAYAVAKGIYQWLRGTDHDLPTLEDALAGKRPAPGA